MFEPALLEELCRQSAGSVQVDSKTACFCARLIVQMKIIPLPVFLENADETQTREVIVSLGQCIRNNAATNIFNKDLDSQELRRRPLRPGFPVRLRRRREADRRQDPHQLGPRAGRGDRAGLVFRGRRDVFARGTRARHAAHEPLRAPLLSRGKLRSADRSILGRRAAKAAARRGPGASDVSGGEQARRRRGVG